MPIELNNRGNLILGRQGPTTTREKLQITPDDDDTTGIGLKINSTPSPANASAGIQIGNFRLMQDTAGDGTENLAVLNAAGTKVIELVDLNGVRKLYNGEIMVETAIPLIFPPSFTSGNNGAFSAMNTLPYAYPACYIWLPINSISATLPAAAGWYYAECSSTTAGTIYNNTWDGASTPTAPTTKTAFVTTGVGAVTGPTTVVAAINLPIAVLDCLENTKLEVKFGISCTNSANAKSVTARMTNAAGTAFLTANPASLAECDFIGNIRFLKRSGAAMRQRCDGYQVGSTAVLRSTTAYQTEDISAAWTLAICPAKATATEALVIDWLRLIKK